MYVRSGWRYLFALSFIPVTGISIWKGGWYAYLTPLYGYFLLPVLELLLHEKTFDVKEDNEQERLSDPVFNGILYSAIPLHFFIIFMFLGRIQQGGLHLFEIMGMIWGLGMNCTVYGINIGHELGHRKKRLEQRLAKLLLMTSLYMHFFIEHNRGHHANVGTLDDPATARYGEMVFSFWIRSVIGGYLSAWSLENTKWQRRGSSPWRIQNEMIQFHLIQLGWLGVLYLVFGLLPVIAFVGSAMVGVLITETVNYIEHYGLERDKKPNGRYQNVLPSHSWNSNHFIGRLILFEVPRHSDHHAHSNRPFQTLRDFPESPQLPAGYPVMMILALLPPLWFWMMNARLQQYKKKVLMHPAITAESNV